MRESKRVRRRNRGVGSGRRVECGNNAVLDGRLDIWDGEVTGNITHYEGAEFVLLGKGLARDDAMFHSICYHKIVQT